MPGWRSRSASSAPTPTSSASPLAFGSAWLDTHPQPDLPLKGESAILVDLGAEQVLWQRNPHSRRAPASLVKLVTAMVAADLAPNLDRQVTVAPEADQAALKAVEPDSTLMGLTAGEVLSVRELLSGLFVLSGNDAAEALARGLVSRQRFLELMNEKAAALGMTDSHFTGPIGLDDPQMRSTAYDLALAAAAIETRYPELAAIAGQREIHLPATATHKAFDGINWLHSFLVGYAGATGMKTGFTDEAGGCVVATATRNGRSLIAVVLHSSLMVSDAELLLNRGFSLPA